MGKDSFNVGATKRFIAICCRLLIFSDVAGISSVKKCAYIGQAAKLFNIDSDYAEPSLYNETETLIASWNGTNNTVAHMNPHYSGKIYMDKERNIWILGVEREDAGRYSVKFGAENKRHEVNITLTVKESRDSINGLLKTIMILVIMILVINITIIVLMNKSLTEFLVKGFLKLHPDFMKKNGYLPGGRYRNRLGDYSEDTKKYLGTLTGEQIGQIRKLLDDHSEHIKEYLGNFTGKQIGQIRKLLDDHSDHIKEYLESIREKDYKDVQSGHKINIMAAPKGDKAQTRNLDKSRKRMKKNPNSDDDNNKPLLGETFNPK